jgi:hypothetical protein
LPAPPRFLIIINAIATPIITTAIIPAIKPVFSNAFSTGAVGNQIFVHHIFPRGAVLCITICITKNLTLLITLDEACKQTGRKPTRSTLLAQIRK